MKDKPILTFEEITSVNSITDLVDLYIQKGHFFSSEEEFVKRVHTDWKTEVQRLKEEAKSKSMPTELPSLDVIVDGVTYKIHGEHHKWREISEYVRLVSDAVNKHPNWIFEQNLGQGINKKFTDGIDITETMDYSVDSTFRAFIYFLPTGLMAPLIVLPTAIILTAEAIKGIAYQLLGSESTKKRDLRTKLNIPLEALATAYKYGSMPAYVEIGLREKSKKPYTWTQKRSAYQAEFMRFWTREEEKNILGGAGHASEIKYFLLHGVKDPLITELARTHVNLLEQNSKEYQHLMKHYKLRISYAYSVGLYGPTLILGLSILAYAAYGIFISGNLLK